MIDNEYTRLGWVEGEWGLLNELQISIADRGLNFADGIFETIFINNGIPHLLDEHLTRWMKSAAYLGMQSPPRKEKIIPLIKEGMNRINLENKSGSIRLNWSRGDAVDRGITDLKQQGKHRFWMEINHMRPSFKPISTIISQHEKRNPISQLSYCKTFAYGQAIQARKEARDTGADDALLVNTLNKICCGTTANLIIKRNNEWFTPPLNSGCLPGIMREQGIKKRIFQELNLSSTPEEKDEWLLINSLSCHPIHRIGKTQLTVNSNAKRIWESLLLKGNWHSNF